MSADEEVQAGLMNAVERGVPMEKAAQSFINAGYPEQTVRAAARAISEGNVSFPHIDDSSSESESAPENNIISAPIPPKSFVAAPKVEKAVEKKEEGVSKTKIILLVTVLVILLGVLIASFFFKDAIISLFS